MPVPRDTTAPAGNGGHRTTTSQTNPTPLSLILDRLESKLATDTQETQETKDREEKQEKEEKRETYRVPYQRGEKVSCVSCVNQGTEGCDKGESCVSCVNGKGGVDAGLQQFLKRAAGRSTTEVEKHRGAEYRSPSWMFARCLKGRDEFARLDAEEATALLDEVIESMFPNSPAPWVELGLPDFDSRGEVCDPRSDFLAVWDTIEDPFQLGSRVHEAARLADEKPLDCGGRFRAADAKLEKLLSLCFWLADLAKGGDFFLSCRDAGDVLGVSVRTANQLLQRAEALNFLRPAEPYGEKDRARRKAKTWRFNWPNPEFHKEERSER